MYCTIRALLWLSFIGAALGNDQGPAPYRLGTEDQVVIEALQAEEISGRSYVVDHNGLVRLPMVGEIKAAGLSIREFEAELTDALSVYIRDPQVTVAIGEYGSQRVSVVGAVENPGILTLRGPKTLLETLSQAGGFRDDASYRVTITRELDRGPLPLENADTDPTGRFSVAEVNAMAVLNGERPQDNILIGGGDVISAPRADLVYVLGEVAKPGGFVLNARETVSVTQAVAFAHGLIGSASPKSARILRMENDGELRHEIPVNLKSILRGAEDDVMMQPDDILMVPSDRYKAALQKTISTAISVGSGLVIFRR